MQYKAILFDVDGVLLHEHEMFSTRLIREFECPEESVVNFFKGVFSQKITRGQADLKEELQPLLEDWNWKGNVNELLDYWFDSPCDIHTEVFNKIKTVREFGVRCFVATNNELYRAAHLKNKLKFKDLFDGMYVSAEIGVKKPEKEFFEYICNDLKQKYDIEKNDILYIDSDNKNVLAGRDIGIKSVLYTKFEDFEKSLN